MHTKVVIDDTNGIAFELDFENMTLRHTHRYSGAPLWKLKDVMEVLYWVDDKSVDILLTKNYQDAYQDYLSELILIGAED